MLKKLLIAGAVASLSIGSYFAVPALAQGGGHTEKHPIIHRAINQLGNIEKELARADNDFKGHKERARDLIRQAEAELKLALQADRH